MDHSKWPGTRDYHWHRIGEELGLKYDSCDWRQVCRLISDPGAWESERGGASPTPHTQTHRERQGSTGSTEEMENTRENTGARPWPWQMQGHAVSKQTREREECVCMFLETQSSDLSLLKFSRTLMWYCGCWDMYAVSMLGQFQNLSRAPNVPGERQVAQQRSWLFVTLNYTSSVTKTHLRFI